MWLDNVVTCDLELITPSAQRDTPETFSLCQSSGGVHTHWVRLNSLGFYSCQPQGILKGSNMRRTRRARSWLDSFAAKQTDEHVLACDTGTHSCCLQAASVSFLFGCRRQLLASVSHTQCVRVCLCTCVCVCDSNWAAWVLHNAANCSQCCVYWLLREHERFKWHQIQK